MSFWSRHQIFEKNSIVLVGGILAVIAIGGLVEITPLFYLKSTIEVVDGIRPYVKEVKEGAFPDDDHSYTVNEAEYEKFATMVAKRRQI